MNTKDIKKYECPEFGSIRAMVDEKDEPWFVGKDVAEKLGYKDPSRALFDHVDNEDKTLLLIQQSGSNYKANTLFINESGLYSLVLSSKLPTAKRFKHWVTSEVLPQIRKTGGYIPVGKGDDDNTILAKALLIAERTIQEQKRLIQEQTPKAEYAEQVLLSPTCYTMTQVAKSLSMTVQELIHTLLERQIIYRSPSGPYMLYAPLLKKGLEAYRTKSGTNLFGDVLWTDTYLVWTEKGRKFLTEQLARV